VAGLVVAAGFGIDAMWTSKSRPGNPNGGTQEYLQGALTAGVTIYGDEVGNFVGLTKSGSEGLSPIQKENMGLSYTATGASSGPRVISVHVARDGSYVVLVSYDPNVRTCWGVLDIAVRKHRSVLGETKQGIYYFLRRNVASAECNASTIVPGSQPHSALAVDNGAGW
jgi:hypothetical protein